MAYEIHARSIRVTAGVACVHGQAVADNGWVGIAIKTLTPASDVARANRANIAVSEQYNMRVKGVIEVPITGFEASVLGDLVYIDPDDNVLATAQAGNNVVLGKVHTLPGVQGCPTTKIRVHLDFKS